MNTPLALHIIYELARCLALTAKGRAYLASVLLTNTHPATRDIVLDALFAVRGQPLTRTKVLP